MRYIPSPKQARSVWWTLAGLHLYWLLGGFCRDRPRVEGNFPEIAMLGKNGFSSSLVYEDACLAQSDARFVLHWRETGNRRTLVGPVDLSSQASIREFVRRFLDIHPRLHLLVNNAGVFLPQRYLSVEGIEKTWATNVLGYHLLTCLLLDRLKAGAPARVVNVASTFAGGLDLADPEFRQRPYDGVGAYRQSKQANRMLTWALAERLAGTGVTANAVHPGGVATGIYREIPGLRGTLVRAWVRLIKANPHKGADTPTWLATSPDVANVSGKFWTSRREVPCIFRDP